MLNHQSIGMIKASKDSQALENLKSLITVYPTSPLKPKAEILKVALEKNLAEAKVKADAIAAVEAAKRAVIEATKLAQAKIDSAKNVKIVAKPLFDSAAYKLNLLFPVNKLQIHSAVIVFNKIDKTNLDKLQFELEKFNKQDKATSLVFSNTLQLDENNTLLLFDEFRNADSAIAYVNILKKAIPGKFTWLKPKDYSFIIISQSNLNLLITNKRFDDYKKVFKNIYNVKL